MPLKCIRSFNDEKTSLGFTLLELMITVTIAALLLGVAIPSFFDAIRSNRLTTNANQLVTAINLARSEAVKRGMPVSVRRVDANSSTNLGAGANWEDGWDVFADVDGDGNFEEPPGPTQDDILLKTFPGLQNSYTLRGNASFTAFIRFMPDGRSNAAGFFTLCEDSDGNAVPEANTSRIIEVNAVGRTSMGVDRDNNHIPEFYDVATDTYPDIATCQP